MGKISDLINGMIQRVLESAEWTSANPTHINTLIQVNAIENPDFETEINELIKQQVDKTKVKKTDDDLKEQREIKLVKDKVTSFDKGHVGTLHNFTEEQFGNVKALATNPAQFMFQAFMKKFAKGAGVLALALFIFEAVKWIIGELLKPGRWLDVRFRREIEKELIAFRSREDKQKLQQGLTNIIVTSMPGLRGGEGQTYNTYRTVSGGQSLYNKRFLQNGLPAEGGDIKHNYGRRRFGQ